MATNLIDIHCARCDENVEPLFSISGVHVKAECPKCSWYIKFVSRGELPTMDKIRLEIWEISHHDTRLIESCKQLSGFYKSKEIPYIRYWDLYLKLKQIIKNASPEC